MIVVTGAAGFIGGNLVKRLRSVQHCDLILVDNVFDPEKRARLNELEAQHIIGRESFPDWLSSNATDVEFIFHLGARTDTSEMNFRVLDSLNFSFSKAIGEICNAHDIPWLYASSAATYGSGEQGFADDEKLIPLLKPLNPYGLSKHLFDLYMVQQQQKCFWAGLKFFNVYGPGEEHKGRMASVAYHAFHQIMQTGKLRLFQSHRPDFGDGEQLRDFIHVDDVVDVCIHFFLNRHQPGIYNVGNGTAFTFNQLAGAIFSSLKMKFDIEYIPIPSDIRDKYQYHTLAPVSKLRMHGYTRHFTSLATGIESYIHYLQKTKPSAL